MIEGINTFEKVKEKADDIMADAQKKKQEKHQLNIEKEERKAQRDLEWLY